MTEQEALFAYIDGELEGEERARIEAMIAADPALQEQLAEHRALAESLQGTFATIAEAPVPAALSVAAAAATVVPLAEARSRRDLRRSSWNLPHWAAMAATLVAGVIGGTFLAGGNGVVSERDGGLVASGRLDHALTTQLASAQGAGEPVRIGLTFRDHGGAICRSFAAEAVEGVACRQGQTWQLKGLLAREKAAGTGDYRMAAGSGATDLVDTLIAGEALDRTQEKAARAAGWAPLQGR